MRVQRSMMGIGDVQYVAADPTLTNAQAQAACEMAKGTWGAPGGLMVSGTCQIDTGPSLPPWCSLIPFASSLFSECALPLAADLVNYGSYTAFKVGEAQGLDAEQTLMDQNLAQSNQLLTDPSGTGNTLENCAYNASAAHPVLAQMVSPEVACALTDPFNSSGLGFVVYGAIALVAFFAIKAFTR